MNQILKPINTVLSVNSILNIKELIEAKVLMNDKYGNQYSHIPPHLSYTIMPFPKRSLRIGIDELSQYIAQQKSFNIRIASIELEERSNFFYLAIKGASIKRHHKQITRLLTKHRDSYIREKDFLRLKKGDFDEEACKYLKEYGNAKVFNYFKSHVTIGNVTVKDVNVLRLKDQLQEILKPILNKNLLITHIRGVFHTDSANNQSEMIQLWDKVFPLK